ncbi:MAG: hypothetical protein ABI844_16570, partial [Saprospiraceae bacterium]
GVVKPIKYTPITKNGLNGCQTLNWKKSGKMINISGLCPWAPYLEAYYKDLRGSAPLKFL